MQLSAHSTAQSAHAATTRAIGRAGWPGGRRAIHIGMLRGDLEAIRLADRAYETLRNGQRFRHDQQTERSRRLIWTSLVDRYQLRPDVITELVDGASPTKSYVRLLEMWASRPEDRISTQRAKWDMAYRKRHGIKTVFARRLSK